MARSTMQVVNGYVCRCCDEVSLARRGLDPKNPTGDPAKERDIALKEGRLTDPAVSFGGTLAARVTPAAATEATATAGRRLDIRA